MVPRHSSLTRSPLLPSSLYRIGSSALSRMAEWGDTGGYHRGPRTLQGASSCTLTGGRQTGHTTGAAMSGEADHDAVTLDQFTRQAEPFASLHTARTDADILRLIRAASRVGPGARVLDVA